MSADVRLVWLYLTFVAVLQSLLQHLESFLWCWSHSRVHSQLPKWCLNLEWWDFLLWRCDSWFAKTFGSLMESSKKIHSSCWHHDHRTAAEYQSKANEGCLEGPPCSTAKNGMNSSLKGSCSCFFFRSPWSKEGARNAPVGKMTEWDHSGFGVTDPSFPVTTGSRVLHDKAKSFNTHGKKRIQKHAFSSF